MIDPAKISRRHLIASGAALAALPLAFARAEDIKTGADIAKAEAEGEVLFYTHDGESGAAAVVEGFSKDFPKIKANYVRAQNGALYNKILSERGAGRFSVDVIQFSEIGTAIDFQKRGGFERYASPQLDAYEPKYVSRPPGYYSWTGVTFAGIAYNTDQVKPRRGAEDLEGPARPAMAQRGQRQAGHVRHAVRAVVRRCASYTATTSGRSSPSSVRAASTPARSCSTAWPRARTRSAPWRNTPAITSTSRRARRSPSWRRPTGCRRRRPAPASSARRRTRKPPSCSSTG